MNNPSIPRSSYGSVALAAWRLRALEALHGADHPATRAALGRWRALAGLPAVEGAVVAWHRELASPLGMNNRSARKHAYPRPRCIHGRPWDACDECPNQKHVQETR